MSNIEIRPSYWASVSGGKDSLFMLKLILSNREQYPLDGVVHFEIEIDFPFIKNVIDYMESECKKFGIPFLRIKPRHSFMELYNKWGFPKRGQRWCNSSYKLDCAKQLDELERMKGRYVVHYIGYCADEEKRFAKRGKNKTEIYPLVQYNVQESMILEWAKEQPIFNDFYKYNRRCGCMFCPLGSRIHYAYLLKYYPEQYELCIKLMRQSEIESEEKLGRPVSCIDGKPQFNSIHLDKVVRNKWIHILERMVKDNDAKTDC